MRRVLLVVGLVALTALACTESPPSGPTLALAYTNVDGVEGFDPSSGDALISRLVDSNRDGLPSAGDEVLTSRYPVDLDATVLERFQVNRHLVRSGEVNPSGSVEVVVGSNEFGDPHRIQWGASDSVEAYAEYGDGGFDPDWAWFIDSLNCSSDCNDSIVIIGSSPSAPLSSFVDDSRPGAGNSDFVDVELRLP